MTYRAYLALLLAFGNGILPTNARATPGDDLSWVPLPINVVATVDPLYEVPPVAGSWLSDLQHVGPAVSACSVPARDTYWLMGDGLGRIWFSPNASLWVPTVLQRGSGVGSAQNSPVRSITISKTGTMVATYLGGGGVSTVGQLAGTIDRQRAPVARSVDGIVWQIRPLPTTCGPHFSATNHSGTWVSNGCSDGILISFDDADTWVHRLTGLGITIGGIGYLNGLWVVGAGVGTSGGIYYSNDLVNWTLATSFPDGVASKRVLSLNGKLIMTGTRRYVAFSTDGINWTQGHLDPVGAANSLMQAGIWHPDFGYVLGGERSMVMYSNDLTTWGYGVIGDGATNREVVGIGISSEGEVYANGGNRNFLYRLVKLPPLPPT